jgi:hypothetical protein
MLKVIWARKTACKEPELEAVQLVGLVVLLLHDTPPVQTQFENCQPVEGEGRLAVARKLLPQFAEDCPFVKVPPHAAIEPGDEKPGKLVGFVLKVIRLPLPLLSVKTIALPFTVQLPRFRLFVSPV